jgi:hypothetical protein
MVSRRSFSLGAMSALLAGCAPAVCMRVKSTSTEYKYFIDCGGTAWFDDIRVYSGGIYMKTYTTYSEAPPTCEGD